MSACQYGSAELEPMFLVSMEPDSTGLESVIQLAWRKVLQDWGLRFQLAHGLRFCGTGVCDFNEHGTMVPQQQLVRVLKELT